MFYSKCNQTGDFACSYVAKEILGKQAKHKSVPRCLLVTGLSDSRRRVGVCVRVESNPTLSSQYLAPQMHRERLRSVPSPPNLPAKLPGTQGEPRGFSECRHCSETSLWASKDLLLPALSLRGEEEAHTPENQSCTETPSLQPTKLT